MVNLNLCVGASIQIDFGLIPSLMVTLHVHIPSLIDIPLPMNGLTIIVFIKIYIQRENKHEQTHLYLYAILCCFRISLSSY